MSSYEEIKDYDEQIISLFEEIQGCIDKAAELSGQQKSNEVLQATNRFKRAQQVFHSFRLEFFELEKGRPEQKNYEKKLKEHKQRLAQLERDIEWAKSDALVGGSRPDNGVDDMSAMEVIDAAKKVQDESKDSIARSQRKIHETQEIGAETSVKLKSQTEQLGRIQEDVRKVESNLKRADRQIRVFMRRMATDRIILFFLLLIVIGVVVIIVYDQVKGSDDIKTSQEDF
eukprot:GCRY01001567.1.p1 GENE.GCRY01001567.1~~GCRY01001567.1.p1  ORF type:complete len:229 (+),score=43.87 GCRY01001567.1:227-913(+)